MKFSPLCRLSAGGQPRKRLYVLITVTIGKKISWATRHPGWQGFNSGFPHIFKTGCLSLPRRQVILITHIKNQFCIFSPVKRLAGILLISVYMLSFAELNNLLKIPVLFEHYKEHSQQEPGISFWSFIKLHYLDPVIVDEDYQKDQQLPFRDTDCCLMTVSSACECLQVTVEIDKPAEITREFHLFNEVNKPQFVSFDIFQPPRCA
jgi:hypothetical protein